MKIKIQNNITKILFLLILFFSISYCDQKIEKEVNKDAQIDVKVFSSLTCPHCAHFHEKVVLKIKSDSVLNNIVNFEHIGFPLDLAALNAEKILYCSKNQENRFELLTHLYNEQNNWASGSNINDINESLKKIANKFKISNINAAKCLKDENLEEKILKRMLDAKKKFKIDSTPTIFINEKKYEGKNNFKSFKKEIEKLL
tara:strand:- start:851 stop:1450 length:600 start_codon:yes stop_codon:yes gene_type:complete